MKCQLEQAMQEHSEKANTYSKLSQELHQKQRLIRDERENLIQQQSVLDYEKSQLERNVEQREANWERVKKREQAEIKASKLEAVKAKEKAEV